MNGIRRFTDRITKMMDIVAAATLIFMMFLTVTDVALRYAGHPFQGTYEMVAFGGATAIAFAMPRTSMTYQNIAVEVLLNLIGPGIRRWFSMFTRMLGIVLFFILGYGLVGKGLELCTAGEVTPGLQIVFYPIVFGSAFCAFIECLTLFYLMIREFTTLEFAGENHGK
jgi:TRAP-type C4-dicarboxylate transport system permease small subunit